MTAPVEENLGQLLLSHLSVYHAGCVGVCERGSGREGEGARTEGPAETISISRRSTNDQPPRYIQ